MADRILTLRELNRATLSRQLLLERHDLPVHAAIERLAGMQAQLPQPPFVGLWTRLNRFPREVLAAAYQDHSVVRATLMRATLHAFTAADYLRFRSTMQAALDAVGGNIVARRGEIDVPAVIEAGRDFFAEKPRTFAELSKMLESRWPETDVGAMRYAIRTTLHLVQVPDTSTWSFPATPRFTLAAPFIGSGADPEVHLEDLVRRYLGAFGPATVRDMQTWSALPLESLKAAFEALRDELVTYRDEKKRELFDLPDVELRGADIEAPIRFLPAFDNLVLSHQDRRRVVPDEFRKGIYLPALRVAATILVDGVVAGAWNVEKAKKTAELVITPFRGLDRPIRDELAAEGEWLLAFLEPAAEIRAVRFADVP